jgi:hypothetical protein
MLAKSTPVGLTEVLAYQHPGLIRRLREKSDLSEDLAALLFEDTKRFLYLCGTVAGPLAPSEPIDECWHQFLLFTQDYAEFCARFFGQFIHHVPKAPEEVAASDGSAIRNTRRAAREFFGELSANWSCTEANCNEQCSPSTSTCGPQPCTSDGKVTGGEGTAVPEVLAIEGAHQDQSGSALVAP